jgi:hypothetical protein
VLDICTFKWKPQPGYRSKFAGEHVNVLAAMVRRHYQKPHRFSCITDDPTGIDQRHVRVIPLWRDHANLQSAYGRRNPSCYRRLKLFSAEAATIIGPRFVSMDLDMVITGDCGPLWDRAEDFVMIKSATPPPRYLYNGSMLLMTAGARRQVWDDFHPVRSLRETVAKRMFGSDQAWISLKLGPGEATWDTADGVYSYRMHIEPNAGVLPANAKMVAFHGATDPWHPEAQKLEWVRQNYRVEEFA